MLLVSTCPDYYHSFLHYFLTQRHAPQRCFPPYKAMRLYPNKMLLAASYKNNSLSSTWSAAISNFILKPLAFVWRKLGRLMRSRGHGLTCNIMQPFVRSRYACSGGAGGSSYLHMRAPLFWLIAAFTIVSCFVFVLMTLSYMSESLSNLRFSQYSAIRGAGGELHYKRAANINCAEPQLVAPPTELSSLAVGKIQNPFSSNDSASSLVRYGIMLVPEAAAKDDEGRKKSQTVVREYRYSDNMPLIFIGGMPRSGTTLMRAMLDAHPEVRCGTETRLVPRILSMRAMWLKSARESTRLQPLHEAGITDDVIDAAVKSFILEIMVRHGELAPRLCNKDPFTLKSAAYLAKFFPHAKFIFMIRDGRATVTSIITRQVTITGFNLQDYRQCMEKWNQAMEAMWAQCQAVGSKRCLPVHYEQVVLHPREQLRRILDFLELPWNDAVLHHEEHIGETGGVQLSKAERSTDQVIKPVNLDALAKWTETFPEDVHVQLASVAPMLDVLGYNPLSRNVSQYGLPDKFVALNTDMLAREGGVWRERQLASVLKGSDSYKYLEREYRLQQASSGISGAHPQLPAAASAAIAAPNLKADFDV